MVEMGIQYNKDYNQSERFQRTKEYCSKNDKIYNNKDLKSESQNLPPLENCSRNENQIAKILRPIQLLTNEIFLYLYNVKFKREKLLKLYYNFVEA